MNTSINKASVSQSDLNALVGSRICHDLISPLGAISNGVELLNMTGASLAPEIALIAESVENANARIRFFRVAFGGASSPTAFAHGEAVSILQDVYKSSRTSVEWQVNSELSRGEVKLAFLLIQCVESAMPWGGTITVLRSGTEWRLIGNGERMRVDEALWDRLSQSGIQTHVAASEVHFALVAQAAELINRSVAFTSSETAVTVTF